jgi:hypothetical protein
VQVETLSFRAAGCFSMPSDRNDQGSLWESFTKLFRQGESINFWQTDVE